MEFLNRQRELGRLREVAASGEPGLVVVWGRRRVGKTRLLLEWCAETGGLYSVGDLSAPAVQRRYLAQAIAARFPGFDEVEYPDWGALLRAVTREASRSGWLGPLVLDEVPYLVEASPELPSVLQAWLDHEARQAGLVVAVSGSSRHLMQGLTLAPDAPLFGRAVAMLRLDPLPVGWIGDALHLGSAADAVRAWAAWGGVPRYWELARGAGRVLDAAVEALVLDPLGPLHREPDRLLAEEQPPATSLRHLLDAIAGGAHRPSEIAGRLGTPATSLSRPLALLAELGLVRREQPFGAPERGGKRSLYTVADPFFRMWFRLVAPNRAALETSTSRGRRELASRFWPGLRALAWEELCRAATPLLAGDAAPGGVAWGPAGRFWRGGGPEWDVVALSTDRRRLLLGEARWHERPVGRRRLETDLRELLAKGRPKGVGRGDEEIVHALFVPKADDLSEELAAGAVVVEASHVVGALR